MTADILVTYATKHGATLEIAEKITAVLQNSGLDVDLYDVEDVEDISHYRAVILGSAVYIGRWQKTAVHFLKAHGPELARRQTYLFSSGPTGIGKAVDLLDGELYPESLRFVIDKIKPNEIVVFHGKLATNTLNPLERFMIHQVKAPVGDFRNWEDIDSWATKIASTLMEPVLAI